MLELAIQELKHNGKHIHVLCLPETFIKKGEERNIKLCDYKLISYFSRANQKWGGTCILLSKQIYGSKCNIIDTYAEESNFKCCAINITCHNLIILCVSSTPASDPSIFFNKLTSILNILTKKIKIKIILTGDLNIDTLKDSINAKRLKNFY